jgi:hypothetical protein
MKLITEEVQQVKFITEGKGTSKRMCIEGVFLQGNICNRNGRMYPMETLSREVKRYNENYIVKGRALGELGHPDGPTVNLDRVSHKIISLTCEGNNFRGKAQLLETPMGKIARDIKSLAKILCLRLLPILLPILLLLMHLYKGYLKVRSGFSQMGNLQSN